jgi:nicotinamide-nucleotide amidase
MPVGEIIAIGTELLLGETQDTNTTSIARTFRDLGIDLYRTMIIGDNIDRIASAIQEAIQRSDIILTTGGLGPTVDDPTLEAVAQAVGVSLEFDPELWFQIQERFMRFKRQPSENNRRQAYIPKGAIAIENPVGTAPAFYFDTGKNLIISLPGVPREMDTLVHTKVIPLLRNRFKLDSIIKIHVLHCAGVGESQVDEWISEFEKMSNPTVGLLAHPGQVDIRITAKASNPEEANNLIATVASQIRERVGEAIFGVDGQSLEEVLIQQIQLQGWSMAVIECGLQGAFVHTLVTSGIPINNTYCVTQPCLTDTLDQVVLEFGKKLKADVAIGVFYSPGSSRQNVNIFLHTPDGDKVLERSYGGPPELGPAWAIKTALDFARKNIP